VQQYKPAANQILRRKSARIRKKIKSLTSLQPEMLGCVQQYKPAAN